MGIVLPVQLGAAPEADDVPQLHLLKMAVGVSDVEDLRRIRDERRIERGGDWVYTRNHPRRADAILAGAGSIYWVIRGQVRVRQLITGFRAERDENGRGYCLIEVDRDLVATEPRPWRAFQGWRYLTPADAPRDLLGRNDAGDDPLPVAMIAELRSLGLL